MSFEEQVPLKSNTFCMLYGHIFCLLYTVIFYLHYQLRTTFLDNQLSKLTQEI